MAAHSSDLRVVVTFDEESKKLLERVVTALEAENSKQVTVVDDKQSLKDHPYLRPSTPETQN